MVAILKASFPFSTAIGSFSQRLKSRLLWCFPMLGQSLVPDLGRLRAERCPAGLVLLLRRWTLAMVFSVMHLMPAEAGSRLVVRGHGLAVCLKDGELFSRGVRLATSLAVGELVLLLRIPRHRIVTNRQLAEPLPIQPSRINPVEVRGNNLCTVRSRALSANVTSGPHHFGTPA